jgi:capsular polysaccharide biosynthesis protein
LAAAARGRIAGGMILVRDIKEIAEYAASGRPPDVTFHQLAPAARSPVRPPLFLLGAGNAEMLWQVFGQIDTPAIGCYRIDDAALAPTGFAIKDGIAFHADAFIHPRHHVVAISDRLNAETLPVRHIDGALAVIYGPGHETWGHWLTDFLPRLWVLHAAGYDLARLRFVMPPDLRDFATPLLALCGLREEQFVVYDYWRELLHADRLLLPTGLRVENRLAPCFAQATAFWTARARANAGAAHGAFSSALYLSRSLVPPTRDLLNRTEIEAIARDFGLVAVRPETLSIAEQIGLFSGARLIVGEYGSALHNAVFAAPGAAVCALRGTSLHPSFVQSGIATALGQELGYVFGDTGGQDVRQAFVIPGGYFMRALEILKEAVLF